MRGLNGDGAGPAPGPAWDPRHPLGGFDDVLIACSFQKEASVVLDLVLPVVPNARVFTLDTGVLFPETHDTWRAFEEHFEVEIESARGEWVDGLWATDPDSCCDSRKVRPLREILSGADAWVSGMRREQSPTRAGIDELEWDAKHGLWKANPLAGWTEADVWAHIFDRGLPYHPLHDQGYGSIGCTHCTAPGNGREGRWAGSEKTECGLHA
jgi:phosphoadenosine phosphosulfate reductase